MKHISQKEYIALMLDLIKEKKRRHIAEHLELCEDCNKRYNVLLQVIKPCFKDKIVSSKNLKNRILNSAAQYRMSNSELLKFDITPKRIWKHIALYASIAATSMAIIFTIVWFIFTRSDNVYLQVARVYGNADIDSMPARLYDMVSSGNSISIDDDSAIILQFAGDYKIMILGKSFLTIEKANLNMNSNLEIKYNIDKGTLLNRLSRNDSSINYAFITPQALINTNDADLILQASNKGSRVYLIKGKLVIQDRNSAEKTTIDSPGRYIISDGVKMARTADSSPRNIQNINEAFDSHDDIDEMQISPECFNIYQTSGDTYKNAENKIFMNYVTSMVSEEVSQPPESDFEKN